jgi:hypothetical protein
MDPSPTNSRSCARPATLDLAASLNVLIQRVVLLRGHLQRVLAPAELLLKSAGEVVNFPLRLCDVR